MRCTCLTVKYCWTLLAYPRLAGWCMSCTMLSYIGHCNILQVIVHHCIMHGNGTPEDGIHLMLPLECPNLLNGYACM